MYKENRTRKFDIKYSLEKIDWLSWLTRTSFSAFKFIPETSKLSISLSHDHSQNRQNTA